MGAQTSQRSNNPNVAHVEAATARARNKVGGDGANVQGESVSEVMQFGKKYYHFKWALKGLKRHKIQLESFPEDF